MRNILLSVHQHGGNDVTCKSRIWPKSKLKKMAAKTKCCILRPFSSTIFSFPRWFRPYTDRSGDRRSRETILKIAQSGHRLSLTLSMGDGRSGWWAPPCANLKNEIKQYEDYSGPKTSLVTRTNTFQTSACQWTGCNQWLSRDQIFRLRWFVGN